MQKACKEEEVYNCHCQPISSQCGPWYLEYVGPDHRLKSSHRRVADAHDEGDGDAEVHLQPSHL